MTALGKFTRLRPASVLGPGAARLTSRDRPFGAPPRALFLDDRTRNSVVIAGTSCPMLSVMDERAIRRAVLLTLRRAIVERFPPGPERTWWLRWAARVAKSSMQFPSSTAIADVRAEVHPIKYGQGLGTLKWPFRSC